MEAPGLNLPSGGTLPIRERPGLETESHLRRNLLVVAMVVAFLVLLSVFLGIIPVFGNGTAVVKGDIDVLLTACDAYQVTVPVGGPSTLQGTFEVLGGAPNQVQVLVMSGSAYGSFKSGCGVVAGSGSGFLYDSGEANSGNFSVLLPGGVTYYVVYNNPQLYNNVIQTKVTLG